MKVLNSIKGAVLRTRNSSCSPSNLVAILLLGVVLIAIGMPSLPQNEGACAKVRLEIQQELTLERQGFDARMAITNTVPGVDVTNLKVVLSIKDQEGREVRYSSDPNDPSALFFVRQSSLAGIRATDGSGVVQSGGEGEAHWLLVPAPGAAKQQQEGARYSIGARVTYFLGGQPADLILVPDTIVVRPMPELTLDYFLKREVQADDPFTLQVESPRPFSLGVRVLNTGLGVARGVQIESAQPRIVENLQNLLIGFTILGGFVDDQSVRPTLLLPFGDIAPGRAKVGRWLMETNLSGRFEDFSARFSHAPEYGGRLTSLVKEVRTHLLIKDVKVTLPGRDSVPDYLAIDPTGINVYESDGVDTAVRDYTGDVTLLVGSQAGELASGTMSVPRTAGPLYVSVADPFLGTKAITKVERPDGSLLPIENAWTERSGNGSDAKYFVRLFDTQGGGTYRLHFSNTSDNPRAPVMQLIPNRTRPEGKRLTFIVEASDPDGSIPSMRVDSLPIGAYFTDNKDGSGIFDWNIPLGSSGRYPLTFRATDGALESARTAYVIVTAATDTDGDGMSDEWEMRMFATLGRDGSGDFDQDGLTDRQEYELGTDPTYSEDGPKSPEIHSPKVGAEVREALPILSVVNSGHSTRVPANYQFELYADKGYSVVLAKSADISEATSTTSWQVSVPLLDNTLYYWRARVLSGPVPSGWSYGRFFRNSANDAPTAPVHSSPRAGSVVTVAQPFLAVTNSTDLDGDPLTYGFELRRGTSTGSPIGSAFDVIPGASGTTQWMVQTPLQEDTEYWWRAFASDDEGATTFSEWSSFFVNLGNNPPTAPVPVAPAGGSKTPTKQPTLIASASSDPDRDPITYRVELDVVNTFNSSSLRSLSGITTSGQTLQVTTPSLIENQRYFWRVSASDGLAESSWNTASFVVNSVEEPPTIPTLSNPSSGSWVEVVEPVLSLNPSTDPDGDTVYYEYEVYGDAKLSQLIAAGASQSTSWKVANPLKDNFTFFWRARAIDTTKRSSPWSGSWSFFVNEDGRNDPPTIKALQPLTNIQQEQGDITVTWTDEDPDSSAKISIFANSILIKSEIPEDEDGQGDTYTFPVSKLTPGSYIIRLEIDDGYSKALSQAPGKVTVLDPRQSDADGDGINDARDNCPRRANRDQRDTGGILKGSQPDKIGDACQCGDVDNDGVVTDRDMKEIEKVFTHPFKKASSFAFEKCDVGGTPGCSLVDASILRAYITMAEVFDQCKKKGVSDCGTPPQVPAECEAAR